MAGRGATGCRHTQAATAAQKAAYRDAVRLHLATALRQTDFEAACATCGNASLPLCCLDCDYIGCPAHGVHEHPLGCCLGGESEGAVWCFACGDAVCDARFERLRLAEVRRALRATGAETEAEARTNAEASAEANAETSAEANAETSATAHATAHAVAHAGKPPRVPYHAFTGLRGLVNLGATCYASVVLQSLVHNPLVRAFFLGGGHQREACARRACLACAVDRLYSEFFGSASVAGYGITDLLVALAQKQPRLGAGSTEQDAHEFYLMLLSEFHAAHQQAAHERSLRLPRCAHGGEAHHHVAHGASHDASHDASHGASHGVENGPESRAGRGANGHSAGDGGAACTCVTHRNFSGMLQSTLSCACGKVTHRREPMVDLGLDVGAAAAGTTLGASLRRFTAAEPVANYACDACGRKNTTTKQLRIAEAPPVLLIQLKRFKHVGGARGSIKVETPVDFPLQLDLAPFTTAAARGAAPRPLVYELYGVICHTGTLDTGHYTCLMKHSSGQWFNFDDVAVTAVDVAAVRRARRAYLLSYVVKWAV